MLNVYQIKTRAARHLASTLISEDVEIALCVFYAYYNSGLIEMISESRVEQLHNDFTRGLITARELEQKVLDHFFEMY